MTLELGYAYNLIELLQNEVGLNDCEQEVLQAVAIRNTEELLSLVYNFPSLAGMGLDLAKLSSAAMLRSRPGIRMAVAQQRGGSSIPNRITLGARHPSGAPGPPGYQIHLPPMSGSSRRGSGVPVGSIGQGQGTPPGGGGVLSGAPSIDLRLPNWNVRDQGDRGTCVAFAVVACREYSVLSGGNIAANARLSEQYLFWATKKKTADPEPKIDGTWIEFGQEALEKSGTCAHGIWPYNPVGDPSNITQETLTDPCPAAHQDAPNWAQKAAHFSNNYSSGGANAVLNALMNTKRPVAISLPVFRDPTASRDPSVPARDNWNTAVGELYGVVIDPPPTSLAVGGHAVCVTGFVPDPQDQTGGYFVFRNSWGIIDWGHSAPASPYHSPEPGYGQVSATYVDRFLWEMGHL